MAEELKQLAQRLGLNLENSQLRVKNKQLQQRAKTNGQTSTVYTVS